MNLWQKEGEKETTMDLEFVRDALLFYVGKGGCFAPADLKTWFPEIDEVERNRTVGMAERWGFHCGSASARKNQIDEPSQQLVSELSFASNETLCMAIQEGGRKGKAAQAALVQRNMRFLYSRAKSYEKRYSRSCFTADDFIQEGVVGLLEAARRFHAERGTKFLTYGDFWIRQRMDRAVKNGGFLVRLPVHVFEQVERLHRMRSAHPEADREELLHLMEESGHPVGNDQMGRLLGFEQNYLQIASLNKVVGEKGSTELVDLLPGDNVEVDDQAVVSDCQHRLQRVMGKYLKGNEQKVIALRFGLGDGEKRTLEEVGGLLGVTRERVRQIESKALGKLRSVHEIQDMYDMCV